MPTYKIQDPEIKAIQFNGDNADEVLQLLKDNNVQPYFNDSLYYEFEDKTLWIEKTFIEKDNYAVLIPTHQRDFIVMHELEFVEFTNANEVEGY